MPGGGDRWLRAFGTQNVAFNGNPSITHFYKVFKRYTHFSMESIRIPLDGPNELQMDTPVRIRAKIPRHADLLRDLTFVCRVPEIYSKVWERDGETPDRNPAFRWIHMLGPLLLDNVAFFLGGAKIQEFPGEWIAARASLDLSPEQFARWKELVGDVPELHSPEWGLYSQSPSYPYQKGNYPIVVADASAGIASAPSIPERTLRIPLPFWFSEESGRALPLIALQKDEIEVQITLRPLREIYRVMDDGTAQKEPNRYGVTLDIDPTLPTSYDPAAPENYDNLTLQNEYASHTAPNSAPRYFYTDVGQPIPAQDGFQLNPYLEGTYVFLTEKEQIMFVERELTHIVHQVQILRFPTVTTRTKLDLDLHGLIQRLVFYARRSDAIPARNDYINLSNWKERSKPPFWSSGGVAVPPINSGRLLSYSQHDILRSARLLMNGNELFEEKPASFFEYQQPYFGVPSGGGSSVGTHPDDRMGPLYQFSFALNGADHCQPSGALNASLVREFQLDVDPFPLDPYSLFAYDFTVICETLNFVKFLSGSGALAFAI